jgi:hypothetical protein
MGDAQAFDAHPVHRQQYQGGMGIYQNQRKAPEELFEKAGTVTRVTFCDSRSVGRSTFFQKGRASAPSRLALDDDSNTLVLRERLTRSRAVCKRFALGKQWVSRCGPAGDCALNAHGSDLLLLRPGSDAGPAADSVLNHPDYGFKGIGRW